jgi:hypothetical protein
MTRMVGGKSIEEVGRMLLITGIATWLCAVFIVLRFLELAARADALTQRCIQADGDDSRSCARDY